MTIREFQSAELTCRAIGKPALSHYIWKQNDIVRTSDAGERIYFPRASRADGGRYTCAGINSVDTGVAAVAYLTVTCEYFYYVCLVGWGSNEEGHIPRPLQSEGHDNMGKQMIGCVKCMHKSS